MAETNSWIKVFRRAIKVSVGTGWTVQPDRGNIRVLYGKKASGFLSINLPYKWQEDQWVEALKLIQTAADRLGKQLRDRSPKNVWLSICKEAEIEGQECTPYSFRHRYAYVAHNRINKHGTYRSPKQIADAMGHDLETHLKSYSRFNTKELENAFDFVEERLEKKMDISK